jgi:hypothetical protein
MGVQQFIKTVELANKSTLATDNVDDADQKPNP